MIESYEQLINAKCKEIDQLNLLLASAKREVEVLNIQ